MDTISKKRRSAVMSKIRSKDTKPEKLLRSALFRRGLRYRIHAKNLPGKPDIIFTKNKVAIFVHGCFWHLHQDCRDGRVPKTSTNYWKPKLLKNVERDKLHEETLKLMGWTVLIFWECEIESNIETVVKEALRKILK